jgi:uncharacterized cofD-like protein
VNLVAELADGRRVRGESAIPQSGVKVIRLAIDPPDALPAPGVLAAIGEADMVILGPGSFYTSVLATTIVPGIAEAMVATEAMKVFVCNLMTEPGETDGFGVDAHLRALREHGLPPETFDYVVLNGAAILEKIRARYSAQGAEPVSPDWAVSVSGAGPLVVTADLLASGPVLRHDHDKIGRCLCALAEADGQELRDEFPLPDADDHETDGLDPIAVDVADRP